jgi:glyoxylase-like metal-dependent hydrolase (beta-lactamase superfamily II)
MMQLGQWRLDTLNGGRFWLDAGVMYGVVPKTVWQAATPPDELNRIPLAIHCVLARNGRQTILIDTGYGSKLSLLDRNAHAADAGDPLIESLAALNLGPDEIDMVVFSHLHWDHVGGATRFDEKRRAVPTFPNATHFINRLEWEDAVSGAPELAGSYAAENFAPLEASGQLVLVDGGAEIVPGLTTRLTGGHTRGHQALLFESRGEMALYPGDLCPDINHVRRMWCAAYDLYPLETRRRKPELLAEAADRAWWLLWDHEPGFAVSRLQRHKSREFVACETRSTL